MSHMDREDWDDERPARRRVYRCSDRMCGASDCETCYGPGAGLEAEEPEEEEAEVVEVAVPAVGLADVVLVRFLIALVAA